MQLARAMANGRSHTAAAEPMGPHYVLHAIVGHHRAETADECFLLDNEALYHFTSCQPGASTDEIEERWTSVMLRWLPAWCRRLQFPAWCWSCLVSEGVPRGWSRSFVPCVGRRVAAPFSYCEYLSPWVALSVRP